MENLKEYLLDEYAKRSFYNIYTKNILLDSSLISQSKRKKTDIKVIVCGDYIQVYYYPENTYITDKNKEEMKFRSVLTKSIGETSKSYGLRKIEKKNINRSKHNLQKIVKCNETIFKTFITLTFVDNMTDIKETNKIFNVWRSNLKRIIPNFAYVCVPEFQKRGAVHYHMMTNIAYTDLSVLSKDEVKIYSKESGWQVGKNIKGWNYGYSLVVNMKDQNVIGYLTKYFTKDIDDRLFAQHRFFYSQNLKKPTEYLFNLRDFYDYINTSEFNEYSNVVYSTTYKDTFDNDIYFVEYKKN